MREWELGGRVVYLVISVVYMVNPYYYYYSVLIFLNII
jgi:hypothetical protein